MGLITYVSLSECWNLRFFSPPILGLLGPAPNIPMSPLMDMHLQLGLLCLVILDLKEKNELEGEVWALRNLFVCIFLFVDFRISY